MGFEISTRKPVAFGTAQHRVATDSLAAAILPIGAATSLSWSISFIPARLRPNANRWAAS